MQLAVIPRSKQEVLAEILMFFSELDCGWHRNCSLLSCVGNTLDNLLMWILQTLKPWGAVCPERAIVLWWSKAGWSIAPWPISNPWRNTGLCFSACEVWHLLMNSKVPLDVFMADCVLCILGVGESCSSAEPFWDPEDRAAGFYLAILLPLRVHSALLQP